MKYLGRCSRDINEPHIVAALRKAGANVLHIEMPADLLVGYKGRNYLMEVKTPKGKMRDSQIDFMARWVTDGDDCGQIAVVRSADEALAVLEVDDGE